MRIILACLVVLMLGVPVQAQEAGPTNAQISDAIDRGVKHLKQLQTPKGDWARAEGASGATALAGWTLLECGVPADDPAVVKAADVVRKSVLESDTTYEIACAVFFLDKLGDPQDERLLLSLGVRLVGGQTRRG